MNFVVVKGTTTDEGNSRRVGELCFRKGNRDTVKLEAFLKRLLGINDSFLTLILKAQ